LAQAIVDGDRAEARHLMDKHMKVVQKRLGRLAAIAGAA
jgi:hypothetical protein